MKVLFDTNVIIDAFTCRGNEYKHARELVLKAVDEEFQGYISSKQVTDIYYILRKYYQSEEQRRFAIKTIMSSFTVLPLLPSDLNYSITNEMIDYEDAVIYETAKVNMVNSIVTSDTKHFKNTKAFIYTPKELVELLNSHVGN